jgi:uncharacterized peroxidase-related enzyme
MNQLPVVEPAHADDRARVLLAGVQKSLGLTPNMMKVMANSPALLQGYLGLSAALAGGVIPAPVAERVALAVAELNDCDYCLSAHSYIAAHLAKVNDDEIERARLHTSADPKTAAILAFAAELVESRGAVAIGELDRARAAGLSDEEIAEVIGLVALNVLTNYFNKAAGVPIDWPIVQSGRNAA